MRLLAIATGLAIALSSTAANALTFTTTLGPTSTEPGAILFNDFDGTQNAGVGTFVGNCNCGQQPNVGNYFGVQNTGSLTLLNPVGYLGFLWGTTDSHNDLLVYGGPTGTTLLGSFSGTPGGTYPAVTPGQTTVYFNLFAGPGEVITSLIFNSGYSFETDNYSYMAATTSETPVPAALPLFASVLAGSGLIAWRKKKKAAKVAA